MNQYHIYEAIGRGKYSNVYKGRKKKTIEYFAVKSIDKSQKSKVLQEVRIIHSLDHSNVLKFYSWYETSAHLWLVLEYCVGGDLMSLLKQDKQLPEDSIHDLARDLVRALQFLHSKGIIYCNLKPSNILLDENGCTKLCDFGLARKLNDISKTPSSSLPQAKHGTPFYMAPDIKVFPFYMAPFHKQNVHFSFYIVPKGNCLYQSLQIDMRSVVSFIDQLQNMEVTERGNLDAVEGSNSLDDSGTVPLLNRDVEMSMKERPRKSCSLVFSSRILTSWPLIFVIAAAAVCCGICVVLLHPQQMCQDFDACVTAESLTIKGWSLSQSNKMKSWRRHVFHPM